jgi:uncharacterized protein
VKSSASRFTRRALIAGAAGAATVAMLRSAAAAEPAGSGEPAGNPPAPEIWDGHTHIFAGSGTIAQRMDRMLECADRVGIRRMVVFMGVKFSADPAPDDMRRQNDDVLEAVAHAPSRIFGFVYLNPKHVDASLAEMERCVHDGPLVGIKLWIAMHCNEPNLDPIVRRAVELKIPVLQHTFFRLGGNLPGESSPADVATLALRHSDARFICAHTGADWERGIRAIRAAPNVWAETSGFDPTAGQVEMAVRELGAARLVFGSDAGGRSFASQLAKVESADLSAADRRLVLHDNLRGLLLPVLTAKGVPA